MTLIPRLQKLSRSSSFFLFGARGTGKTTLLQQLFPAKNALWIDLLSFEDEDRFSSNPDLLSEILAESRPRRVIIDEIQKVPKILDIVHREMQKSKKTQFILTGSSSRKLKRGAADLLAGRALSFALHPLTHKELGDRFDLQTILQAGSLPSVFEHKSLRNKSRYLTAYTQTYLKEEILLEQIVRKTRPFKGFLEIAAQCNGQIVNYSKIAKNLRADWSAVKNYFDILEDTYLGFYLRGFDRSVRKQQNKAPKFYFFDLGVWRALLRRASVPLANSGYEYGVAFESFLILEAVRLNSYYEKHFVFSYLRDQSGNEIDLIVQKPSGEEVLVEIKSAERTYREDGKTLEKFLKLWDRPCSAEIWSRDKRNRKVGPVRHFHWKTALQKLTA